MVNGESKHRTLDRSTSNTVLLDTKQTKDLTQSLKKRRIEIFFRGRYVSIGNNVNMKDKINKFADRQTKLKKKNNQSAQKTATLTRVPSSQTLLQTSEVLTDSMMDSIVQQKVIN